MCRALGGCFAPFQAGRCVPRPRLSLCMCVFCSKPGRGRGRRWFFSFFLARFFHPIFSSFSPSLLPLLPPPRQRRRHPAQPTKRVRRPGPGRHRRRRGRRRRRRRGGRALGRFPPARGQVGCPGPLRRRGRPRLGRLRLGNRLVGRQRLDPRPGGVQLGPQLCPPAPWRPRRPPRARRPRPPPPRPRSPGGRPPAGRPPGRTRWRRRPRRPCTSRRRTEMKGEKERERAG